MDRISDNLRIGNRSSNMTLSLGVSLAGMIVSGWTMYHAARGGNAQLAMLMGVLYGASWMLAMKDLMQ